MIKEEYASAPLFLVLYLFIVSFLSKIIMANIKITEGQYNRLFDKPKDVIISESQYNKMFSLITEDRESKNVNYPYLKEWAS